MIDMVTIDEENFWNDDLVKEACEYVGLRISSKVDIKQGVSLLIDDFKESKTKAPDTITLGKDYEILQCKAIDNSIHPYQSNLCLGADPTFAMCTIYSVKRLSDGVVFAIGDGIEFNIAEFGNELIDKFHISGFDNTISAYHAYVGRGLKAWKKVKQPLSTTHKGLSVSDFLDIKFLLNRLEPTIDNLNTIQDFLKAKIN